MSLPIIVLAPPLPSSSGLLPKIPPAPPAPIVIGLADGCEIGVEPVISAPAPPPPPHWAPPPPPPPTATHSIVSLKPGLNFEFFS